MVWKRLFLPGGENAVFDRVAVLHWTEAAVFRLPSSPILPGYAIQEECQHSPEHPLHPHRLLPTLWPGGAWQIRMSEAGARSWVNWAAPRDQQIFP